jgi:ParB family transcriptional regulator, chromosome partitioning protein
MPCHPKASADLSSMKKADAAAAAELRLAHAHWLPDILTHRDVPVINHYDADDEGATADMQDEIDGELNGGPDDATSSAPDMHYQVDSASIDTDEDMSITDDSASVSLAAWPFPTSATVTSRHAVR